MIFLLQLDLIMIYYSTYSWPPSHVMSLCIERREQNQIMVLMVCRILENKNHLLDNDRIVSIEKEIFFKLRHALT